MLHVFTACCETLPFKRLIVVTLPQRSMGKKVKQSTGLGRALVKQHQKKLTDRRSGPGNTFLHTADMHDGQDWARLNLRSITERSSLDEFLATAELAGRDFTAERESYRLITGGMPSGLLSKEEEEKVQQLHSTYKDSLRIPRRPQWDRDMSKGDLEAKEKEAFLNWRRALSMVEEKEHIVMTPYEKNLTFWRQLWRVIERSDVVVQIVDARNPLLFWCQDLDVYVKEVDPNKTCVLMINKADFLSPAQREKWADYFSARNVRVVFWSARLESERLAEMEKEGKGDIVDEHAEEMEEVADSEDEEEEEENENAGDQDSYDGGDEENTEEGSEQEKEESAVTVGGESRVQAGEESQGSVEGCGQCVEAQDRDLLAQTGLSVEAVVDASSEGTVSRATEGTCPEPDQGAACFQRLNSSDILSGPELLKFFHAVQSGPTVQEGITTVGLVGYPNVGKSSTINAILNMKKVPVSATPGRTKHFQTLYVDKHLLLCDCPGLVFPSFVSTKADLIINGVLPVDQMRDSKAPTTLVCRHIPREVLEDMYGIMLPVPLKETGEDPSRPPTADELLSALATMRGYFSCKGNPDCSRASRCLLKDYVNGKLLYCQPPPGVPAAEFQEPHALRHPTRTRQHHWQQVQKAQRAFQNMEERLYEDFQAKMRLSARSKGVQGHGVEFVRAEGLRQVTSSGHQDDEDGEMMADTASVASSSVSGMGKPWKKHHNRNKKEKLRRQFGDTFYTT